MANSRPAVLITGSNGRLGRALLDGLGSDQILIFATNRNSTEMITGRKRVILGDGCDLATREGASNLHKLINSQSNAFDKLSIVSCVGYFPGYQNLLDCDFDQSDRVFRSNFVAVYFT